MLQYLDIKRPENWQSLSFSSYRGICFRRRSENDGIGRLGIRDQMILHAIDAVSFRIHEKNPTHGVGLLCNVLLKAPIKRDTCSRMGKRMGLVLATANGFDKGDLEDLDAALRVKGSLAQYSDFENFLLSKGWL